MLSSNPLHLSITMLSPKSYLSFLYDAKSFKKMSLFVWASPRYRQILFFGASPHYCRRVICLSLMMQSHPKGQFCSFRASPRCRRILFFRASPRCHRRVIRLFLIMQIHSEKKILHPGISLLSSKSCLSFLDNAISFKTISLFDLASLCCR